jgi:hypothetical protein
MTYTNDNPGVVGIAWIGAICTDLSQLNYRSAIVEYYSSISETAEVGLIGCSLPKRRYSIGCKIMVQTVSS